MDGCCKRFVLPEDLGNVNPGHEFISMYMECDFLSCWWWYWYEMMLMLMMILRWDDVEVDNDIEMRWCWWCHCDDVCCVCTYGVQWPRWISLEGETECLTSFKHPWRMTTLDILSESVMWTRLGYFLMNGTILHFRVESGRCIILSIIDLNCGKVDD